MFLLEELEYIIDERRGDMMRKIKLLCSVVLSAIMPSVYAANTNTFVNNVQIRSNIAAFFLERATCEVDSPLYVDEVACRLNSTYRHSQERRDNLARLRKPGLTGLPAQIYDAAQRDALPKEEE